MSFVKKATAVERPLAELELLDSWFVWREASEDVRTAYRWWGQCDIRHRPLAFGMYRVALDREREAASILEDWAERVRLLGPW